MKKSVGVLVCSFLVMAALVGPAGAFRQVARSDYDPGFRDKLVCKDGINFDLALIGGATDFPSGTVSPTGPVNESLYITTEPESSFPLNPAYTLEPEPTHGLATIYTINPLADNDPYWDDVTGFDPTGRELWGGNFSARWTLPAGETELPVGTELIVYMEGIGEVFMENEPTIDTIYVADCTLFDPSPCDSPDAIRGTAGDDLLIGTAEADIICGFGGNDRIIGYSGDDLIYGGDGDDRISGNRGDDTIYGEGGADWLYGMLGDDTMYGGDGVDHLMGYQGNDVLIGGADLDILRGGSGADTLIQ